MQKQVTYPYINPVMREDGSFIVEVAETPFVSHVFVLPGEAVDQMAAKRREFKQTRADIMRLVRNSRND